MSIKKLCKNAHHSLCSREPHRKLARRLLQENSKQTVVSPPMGYYSAIERKERWHTQLHGWIPKIFCWKKRASAKNNLLCDSPCVKF